MVMAQNIVRPNIPTASELELQSSYTQNMSSFNRLADKSPYDGMVDKMGEVRLRLAMVESPEITRDPSKVINPLDVTNVFNLDTGNVVLKWLDTPGGVIRPEDLSGDWKYNNKNEKYNPEERDFNVWEISSRREMIPLTHAFIWTNLNNWCGLNYIPPVGSIVVVGFRKYGFPIILGYVQQHFKICYPTLQPGEMAIKGYGNNYTHWRWTDKLDMKAWSVENQQDIDDPSTPQPWRTNISNPDPKLNPTDCTLWLRLNANDREIIISAFEVNKDKGGQSDKHATHVLHDTHSTNLIIRPRSFTVNSAEILDGYSPGHTLMRNTKYYQDEDCIELTANNPVEQYTTTRYQTAKYIQDTSSHFPSTKTSTRYQDPDVIKDSVVIAGQGSSTIQTVGSFIVNASQFTVNSSVVAINGSGSATITTGGQLITTAGNTKINGGGECTITAGVIKLN
jgi:hypothetical protein